MASNEVEDKDPLSDFYGVRLGGDGNGHDDNIEEESKQAEGDEGDNQEKEEEENKSPSEILLDLVNGANILLFKDQYKIPHVLVTVGAGDNEHTEILRVESSAFRRYLTKLEQIADQNHINTDHDSWPRSADALTKRLKIISSNLREGLGINISIGKIRTGTQRGLSITRVWKNALHASAPYQTTFDTQFETAEEQENNSIVPQKLESEILDK